MKQKKKCCANCAYLTKERNFEGEMLCSYNYKIVSDLAGLTKRGLRRYLGISNENMEVLYCDGFNYFDVSDSISNGNNNSIGDLDN